MWLPGLTTILVGLLGLVCGDFEPSEVCYEHLGCFSDALPWSGTVERPLARLPWSPEQIATRFFLYTSQNPTHYQEVSASVQMLDASNYKPSRKTRFVVHGFLAKGDDSWPSDMCMLMMKAEDVNCIFVDWTTGGRTEYSQAANNVRVVGAQLADLMSVMKRFYGQSPADMHVIGHSLGAHVAAEAGRRTPGLARITGLDPAEPYFQGCPTMVRLDPTDAKFVDVIHTDASPFASTLGFGMSEVVGHVDFFPNGGEQMPGCRQNKFLDDVDPNEIWEGSMAFQACNHQRAHQYYSDTILNPSGFTGYACNDYYTFEEGHCFPCTVGECPIMGHFADGLTPPDGVSKMKFFMNTGEESPFMSHRYHVNVTIDGTMTSPGFFKVALYGASSNTHQHRIFIGFLQPGASYDAYIDTKTDVEEITHVKFVWDDNIVNPLALFGASRIEVLRGRDGKMYEFCGEQKTFEHVLQTLKPCDSQ